MRRHAVLLTVLFALGVTLLSVSFAFWEFYKLNRTQHINNMFMKYPVIMRVFREHHRQRAPQVMLEANMAVYSLDMIFDDPRVQRVLKYAKVLRREGFQSVEEELFFDKSNIYKQKMVQDMRVSMFQLRGVIYFYIESPNNSVLLKDTELKPYTPWNLLYAYSIIISIIIVAYVLILQRIRPLRQLRRRIAAFGAGKMDVSFAMYGHDEIALVANELEDTRKKIQTLVESRTLFLRNIMHELKTPIAKGRIASQMLESDKQRIRFNTIFERMEFLINEFALIEEVSSGSEHIEKQEYRLIDLIDGAVDLAMIESDAVDVVIDPAYKLNADFRLFATAIKNIIDNALKYSSDHAVCIGTEGDEIWFDSRGEALKHPLAYYVEPFTKERPSKDSFGLGLYLVDSILKVHGMVLAYEYHDGINRFIFVPEPT